MIHEVERRLRVTEPVIKFISVRVDENHKRLEKIKALRASRVKRSPASAGAAAAAPVPAAAAEPAPEAGSEPAAATV
jgi:small subunit ribosomal protein S6